MTEANHAAIVIAYRALGRIALARREGAPSFCYARDLLRTRCDHVVIEHKVGAVPLETIDAIAQQRHL